MAASDMRNRRHVQPLLTWSTNAAHPITTLVNAKEKAIKSEKTLRAIVRVGQAVNLAVERFVSVGETIADENPDIKAEMYDACREARAAGVTIEQLCEIHHDGHAVKACADKNTMVRAARNLLTSVTRVLLLADTVVVKQMVGAKDRVANSLSRLEKVANFTEFVKAFSQFGNEMVSLAHQTGDRQNVSSAAMLTSTHLLVDGRQDLKNEKRRSQMTAARQILERCTMLLLTSSKTCLRHPDCATAWENRDAVFLHMRKAMDLVQFVIQDGGTLSPEALDLDNCQTAHNALKKFEDLVEMTRMTLVGPLYRERLSGALEAVVERTQDFTDSAYTSHSHRERILLLCDRSRLELNQLLRIGLTLDQAGSTSPSEDLEAAIIQTLRATKDLKQELQDTALDQLSELTGVLEDQDMVNRLRTVALSVFLWSQVCKLVQHVAAGEGLQVMSRAAEAGLRVFGVQVLGAAHALCRHPSSKIARENLEVIADVWRAHLADMAALALEVRELCRAGRGLPDRPFYMSLPRPGEQAKMAKLGLEMKLLTSELEAEAEKWPGGPAENDVVRRARVMSQMAFSMYQFTRGEGELRTTQDLFTQAEFLAEEANKLYKLVRQFSYQVPAGVHKKELLEFLDKVPTFVQQLQFTVKNPTVGKAATFTKVDNVIQETKNLMNIISKVVTTCFMCATKYDIDFRGISSRSRPISPYHHSDPEFTAYNDSPSLDDPPPPLSS
ncbi:CTNNAL1 [Cordylochernes scorpioides]|uniref:CTNNAL1 n=1 Tax=Cordylochernes scorpioides TaxID=51811 RepID=A0ABY6K105_9ARAC|nr:CTNNAL1 [Cordylochernes scorpioides]